MPVRAVVSDMRKMHVGRGSSFFISDLHFAESLFQTCSRACLKIQFRNLHAPLCGIFHPNSVAVARYGASSGRNLPQIVTHILQKAFFKHALVHRFK